MTRTCATGSVCWACWTTAARVGSTCGTSAAGAGGAGAGDAGATGAGAGSGGAGGGAAAGGVTRPGSGADVGTLGGTTVACAGLALRFAFALDGRAGWAACGRFACGRASGDRPGLAPAAEQVKTAAARTAAADAGPCDTCRMLHI